MSPREAPSASPTGVAVGIRGNRSGIHTITRDFEPRRGLGSRRGPGAPPKCRKSHPSNSSGATFRRLAPRGLEPSPKAHSPLPAGNITELTRSSLAAVVAHIARSTRESQQNGQDVRSRESVPRSPSRTTRGRIESTRNAARSPAGVMTGRSAPNDPSQPWDRSPPGPPDPVARPGRPRASHPAARRRHGARQARGPPRHVQHRQGRLHGDGPGRHRRRRRALRPRQGRRPPGLPAGGRRVLLQHRLRGPGQSQGLLRQPRVVHRPQLGLHLHRHLGPGARPRTPPPPAPPLGPGPRALQTPPPHPLACRQSLRS